MEGYTAAMLSRFALLVDFATGVAIAVGICVTILRLAAAIAGGQESRLDEAMPTARLALGRWLSLALELALAADILRTIIVPSWNEIGKLGAIAALRTVLNYFLAKEIDQQRQKSDSVIPLAA